MSRNAQTVASRRCCLWRLLCLCLLLPPLARAQEPGVHNALRTNVPTARVVIIEDPDATQYLKAVPERVQAMVQRGVTNLMRTANARSAWSKLVATNDIIGIKVFTAPGPFSGTRKSVVAAVIQELLNAGIPPRNIVIWDRHISELTDAGYPELAQRFGVRMQGSVESGYDLKVFYDKPLLGTLAADDVEFGKTGPGVGRKSYVSKLLTQELTKVIVITPMLHHNVIGVTGNLYSMAFGSVDNIGRFENKVQDMSLAVPEICALPIKGDDFRLEDRVVLNIVDALICQYEGQDRGLLHYSTVLNQLRFSKDPVALDVLSLQEISAQRQNAGADPITNNIDLYANAALLELGINDTNRIQVEKYQ
ncbi:MAG TPA: DUF362 domain-containing protein [Verrucomicrobiae bacterium]|nr:DUF362 domain-containing protein [Verrucomicrobiae bacterium]